VQVYTCVLAAALADYVFAKLGVPGRVALAAVVHHSIE
jgi:hypothetical protein